MAVQFKPEGSPTVTPYLVVKGADKLIDFLKTVFGAEEKERIMRPDGAIMHAEVKIGESLIMMGEASDKWPARPANLYVYVDDTDAAYRRALEVGGTSLMEPADQFYGDRNAGVTDAAGNCWWIATHVEDVSQEEIARRAQQFMQKAA